MEREQQVNQALVVLQEAFRIGKIPRSDYRAQRRTLLGSLCDSRSVTTRHTLRRSGQSSQPVRDLPEFSTRFRITIPSSRVLPPPQQKQRIGLALALLLTAIAAVATALLLYRFVGP